MDIEQLEKRYDKFIEDLYEAKKVLEEIKQGQQSVDELYKQKITDEIDYFEDDVREELDNLKTRLSKLENN